MEAVFVAEGEVVEEVFDGEDAAFGEAGGDAGADVLDELDGRGELERHGFDGSSGGRAGESGQEQKKKQNPKGNDSKKGKGNSRSGLGRGGSCVGTVGHSCGADRAHR